MYDSQMMCSFIGSEDDIIQFSEAAVLNTIPPITNVYEKVMRWNVRKSSIAGSSSLESVSGYSSISDGGMYVCMYD